ISYPGSSANQSPTLATVRPPPGHASEARESPPEGPWAWFEDGVRIYYGLREKYHGLLPTVYAPSVDCITTMRFPTRGHRRSFCGHEGRLRGSLHPLMEPPVENAALYQNSSARTFSARGDFDPANGREYLLRRRPHL